MVNVKKVADEDFDLTDELEEAADSKTRYVVLTGGYPEGETDSLPLAYLVSRCAFENGGGGYDAEGREVPRCAPRPKCEDRKARRTLVRIRDILGEARGRGVRFVCCYHVEGDAGWYMEWSDHYDQYSATEAVLEILGDGRD